VADRLFLDANVLFSAAYSEKAGVRRLWQVPGVTLVTSAYAVEEAIRNLSDEAQRRRLQELLEFVEVTSAGSLDPKLMEDVALPDKDLPILGAAVSSGATHLVTGDRRDFGRYFGQIVLGVLVLPPADYLRRTS
jgi:predicted nucleic acid-binding protein